MRVYIGASWYEQDAYRKAKAEIEAAGHEVTHDWTTFEGGANNKFVGKELKGFLQRSAAHDFTGVWNAQIFVLLNDWKCGGAYTELGIALAIAGQVFVIGREKRDNIFFWLPQVRHVSSVAEMLEKLQ